MRLRLARADAAQLDAFEAPAVDSLANRTATPVPVHRSPSRSPLSLYRLLEPLAEQAVEPQELWLGAHLPALSTAISQSGPGEAHRRRRLLERVAMSAQRFTPRVCLAPPDGLLLEVKGSLKLFSGMESICLQLEQLHRSAGIASVLAVAPTPLAALARARAAHEPLVMDRARLVGSVSSLPLSSLRWPVEVIARLAKIGVYTVGQVLRLPRAGFARRFGVAQLRSLDRLTGRLADPIPQFHPRERFRRRRELSYEMENHEALLHALQPILQELEKFLRVRQAGITRLECRFKHRHTEATFCVLQLAAPASDAQHFHMLLTERLSRLVLPEPVRACEVRTDLAVPLTQPCNSLWQPGEHGGASAVESTQLIEYLRARLSPQAVHGLRLISNHWPESASCASEPALRSRARIEQGLENEQPLESARPLWLLAEPQPLEEREGMPWYHGRLQLCKASQKCNQGKFKQIPAERIETAHGARDYYVARDAHRVRLWIFREQGRPHRWFLHGMFG